MSTEDKPKPTHATCQYCRQPMAPGNGCTQRELEGRPARIPYEDEDNLPCHDCNIHVGQLHHPGCDWERCSVCKGQAAFCECTD